jgi:pimeloyl-ACP methyl ester carboxylesterase
VCGLSFGGGLAIALYEIAPSLPGSLILASAYAGWSGSLAPDEVQQRLEGLLRDSELEPHELVSLFLPTLFSTDVPQRTIDEITAVMLDVHPAASRTLLRMFAAADLRHVLPTIRVPTLLLYGSADVRAPREVAEQLHVGIEDSRLVFIEGVGHQSNLEAPARFNEEVRAFLRAVD